MCVPRALSYTGHLASLVHPPDADALVLGMKGVRTEAGLGIPTWDSFLHTSWGTSPWRSWQRATPSGTHRGPRRCLGGRGGRTVGDQLREGGQSSPGWGSQGASTWHPHLCGRGESGRLMSAAQRLSGRGCWRPQQCGSPPVQGTGRLTPPRCSRQTGGWRDTSQDRREWRAGAPRPRAEQ